MARRLTERTRAEGLTPAAEGGLVARLTKVVFESARRSSRACQWRVTRSSGQP
ncbi:MAG: hypothetical protein ACRDRI_19100 [Pseudonocardiaceae bacterium]